jgi:magnesium-transporting ATPase (P-type)
VTAQIGYIFNCRNLRDNTDASGFFLGNPYLYVGIAAIISCQVLFTYAPPFQYVFHTEPIDGESWGKIILLAVVVFCAVETEKIVNHLRLKLTAGWFQRAPEAAAPVAYTLVRRNSGVPPVEDV